MTETAPKTNALFDTHCHLDDPVLSNCLETILENAARSSVCQYVIPGVAIENWHRISEIAAMCAGILPAYGIHPMNARKISSIVVGRLVEMLPKAVAIGEIGLDYSYQDVPKDVQADLFRNQLRIAVDAGLPVLIHCRRAFHDLLNIMKEEQVSRVGGIMHAFSGSPEIALDCIRLGLKISVAGPVTWGNAVRPVKVVERIPLDHLVLETDAPDLSPEPFRGRANEPAFLRIIAEKVALIKRISYEEVAEVTTANARQIFAFGRSRRII